MNEKENLRAINKLEEGLNTSWDLFLYGYKSPDGDKRKDIKPGDIRTYGTIVGQREVRQARIAQMQNQAGIGERGLD